MIELSTEERMQIRHAIGTYVVDLLHDHPALANIVADDFTLIFQEGVKAGCDATIRVLERRLA